MPVRPRRDEFTLIEELFAPLAAGEAGALGLRDDAALIAPAEGCTLIATTDMLISGVHFLADDPSDLVARKLLRVNLSDLAAMGARPRGYLLGLAVPKDLEGGWVDGFAAGLAEDQAIYGIALLGGDTTSTPGPISLSLTAFGEVENGTALHRSGARPGDDIYVSGTIGDAALGLGILKNTLPRGSHDRDTQLIERYQLPQPRIVLGTKLRGLATAAADISDGLVGDLGHICYASGVRAEIELDAIPLSDATRTMSADPSVRDLVLAGGDDYELIFTVAPDDAMQVRALAAEFSLRLTRLGRMSVGAGVKVFDSDGSPLDLQQAGYRHFAGIQSD